MKKIFGCLALLISPSIFAFSCLDYPKELGVIECTIYQGLPSNEGRYIKTEYTWPKGSVTDIVCMGSAYEYALVKKDAVPGTTHIKLSMCNDKAGSKCTLVKDYSFFVYKTPDNEWHADPSVEKVNFTPFVPSFPKC